MNYGEKFMLWKVKVTHIFEESRMKTEELNYTADLQRTCSDAEHSPKLNRMGHKASVQRKGGTFL